MEEAKGHRRYQQFLDRQSVLTSLPNHVHRPRQPETTGVLPNPSHLPSPLPSPPSTRSSTFYTLPRVPNSPTLFTSPNFTSPLWSRNQPLTADFRQRPHRPPQVPSPWEGLRRTGGGVKGGVRTEGGMRGAMDPPERLVSAAKDTGLSGFSDTGPVLTHVPSFLYPAGTPPAPPTRCREVLQWSQWLDELNQDSSRRRAEIEVSGETLRLLWRLTPSVSALRWQRSTYCCTSRTGNGWRTPGRNGSGGRSTASDWSRSWRRKRSVSAVSCRARIHGCLSSTDGVGPHTRAAAEGWSE